MSLITFWQSAELTNNYQHPKDVTVLNELSHLSGSDINFDFPPGPFFGPLKTAKIILCYANPGIDSPSLLAISDSKNCELLLSQLQGNQPYPHALPGWHEWFSQRANSLFGGDINTAGKNIVVLNLLPYASVNMDKIEKIANCLPSVWAAQQYLRETLIPKAQRGEILLIMCRSSHLWGLRSSHNCQNIIINNTRSGFLSQVKAQVSGWMADNIISD